MQKASTVAGNRHSTIASGDRLLRVLAELRGEVATDEAPSDEVTAPLRAASPHFESLSAVDGRLIAEIRTALSGLAGPVGGLAEAPVSLRGALDGVDFVIRGDILTGRLTRLPELLPSFVFLVLLPVAGKAEALRLADRAGSLISQPA